MSLSGRLEDLQLRDLLQILGLSHNSGLLQLGRGSTQAELLLDEGLVVSAWRQGEGSPGEIVDAALLNRARQRQQESVPFRSLDRLLVEDFGLPADTLYSSLRPAVFALITELLHWFEGDFSFHPLPVQEALEQIACGEHLCLDQGLRAADLLRDDPVVLPGVGTVDSASLPIGSRDDAPHLDADSGGEEPAVLLVDDDVFFARRAASALSMQGVLARCFTTGGELLDAARAHWRAGRKPLLIIDLIMPRQHGGGLLGGLELVEQVRGLQPDQACLVYSDFPCPEIEQRLRHLGVDELLIKPRPSGGPDAGCQVTDEFFDQLTVKVTGQREMAEPSAAAMPKDKAAEPSFVDRSQVIPEAPSSAGLALLKGMLQEMQSVESGDQIMLLVLRFATEILHRAVLFSVDRERIVGLGQFGHGGGEISADEKVRRIIIPLAEQSSLRSVVERSVAWCGLLDEGEWDRYLRRELGLDQQDEVFIGPVLKNGRVVALLCGDNRRMECGDEQQQMLEIFLQQAGAALEKQQLIADRGNLSALLGKSFSC